MPPQINRIGCAAQNFQKGRPSHLQVEAIVIHLIDGSQTDADGNFLSPASKLKRSAHYSVSRAGEIHQYVDEEDTAFHCGVLHQPTWSGMKRGGDGRFINPNYYTIGIEHEGHPDDPWPDAMYAASAWLLADISGRHPALSPLTRRNVVMHREIRATSGCPGQKADLTRLILEAGGTPPDDPLVLRARSAVNVRHGQPATSAPIVRVIPAGELLTARARVTGESVNGVSVWYQNMDDDYIWGGAVTE
jgi:hypothetical protein